MSAQGVSVKRSALIIGLLLFLVASGFASGQRAKDKAMPASSAMSSEDKMMADDKMEADEKMKSSDQVASDDTMMADGKTTSDDTMMADDKTTSDDTMMASDKMGDESGMSGMSRRVAFSNLDAARSLATKAPAVLFFSAAGCRTCQTALEDIDASGTRLGDITIVVVDYDTARELRGRYGVDQEHTFVSIDADGKALATWRGGSVDGILDHVAKQGSMM